MEPIIYIITQYVGNCNMIIFIQYTSNVTCKNLTQADMKGSPCSLILSVSHFSNFRYSRLDARHAKSITNGKDWAFNSIDKAWKNFI